MAKYLTTPIAETKRDMNPPRYGMTADGYTKRSGAPSSWRIRLEGETRFRRVMVWQFSNAGTAFVRIKGECLIVDDHQLRDAYDRALPTSEGVTHRDSAPQARPGPSAPHAKENTMSLYTTLRDAGVPLDNHESDLYAKVTPESTRILNATAGYKISRFRNQVDGEWWYDIPFAFDPWWEARTAHRV